MNYKKFTKIYYTKSIENVFKGDDSWSQWRKWLLRLICWRWPFYEHLSDRLTAEKRLDLRRSASVAEYPNYVTSGGDERLAHLKIKLDLWRDDRRWKERLWTEEEDWRAGTSSRGCAFSWVLTDEKPKRKLEGSCRVWREMGFLNTNIYVGNNVHETGRWRHWRFLRYSLFLTDCYFGPDYITSLFCVIFKISINSVLIKNSPLRLKSFYSFKFYFQFCISLLCSISLSFIVCVIH